jgi:hypothetical protein
MGFVYIREMNFFVHIIIIMLAGGEVVARRTSDFRTPHRSEHPGRVKSIYCQLFLSFERHTFWNQVDYCDQTQISARLITA